MLSDRDRLIELVKELETRSHIFSTDPLLVTEKLKSKNEIPLSDKLYERAILIDSNHNLRSTLDKINHRIKTIIFFISAIWSVSGFLGLFALLHANTVNFFYILVCLLGFNSFMLMTWIGTILIHRKNKQGLFSSLVSPSHLLKGKDSVTQSAITLYEKQIKHSGMQWYLGKINHQLWLATLTGMLFALITLFTVRNFVFTWESTLLSQTTVMKITHWMSWLPDLVGFPTPSDSQILQSQKIGSKSINTHSYEWAMLLIGSLVMYGIVPRLLLWISCLILFKRKTMTVDLQEPYYQKIISYWSNQIIDPDDFKEKINALPTVIPSNSPKVTVLFEHALTKENWYKKLNIDTDVNDFGLIDDRDQINKLLSYLKENQAQVIMGIQLKTLPDRGTMRKLEKIANQASDGLLVYLIVKNSELSDKDISDRLTQWQIALSNRNISIIEESI